MHLLIHTWIVLEQEIWLSLLDNVLIETSAWKRRRKICLVSTVILFFFNITKYNIVIKKRKKHTLLKIMQKKSANFNRRICISIQKNSFSFVVVWLFLLFSLTNTCSGGFSSSEGVASIGGQSGVSRRMFSMCRWCVPIRERSFRDVDDRGARLKLILSFSMTYSLKNKRVDANQNSGKHLLRIWT